jgi:hypothetical protein
MDIKQSTATKVPVRLLDSSGVGVTGKAFGDATVYLQAFGGSSAVKVLGAGDWVEVDSTNMPGVYDLSLAVGDVATTGMLKYSVAASGAVTYVGIVNVVAYTLYDTYSQALVAATNASTAATNASNAETAANAADTTATTVRKLQSNRLKIDTGANTCTLYDDDDVTPLFVWNLKDSSGSPTSTSIFERDPV